METLKSTSKIFSLHFKSTDNSMSTNRKVLMANAVPTLDGSNTNEVEM